MTVTRAQCPDVFRAALAEPESKDGKILVAMGTYVDVRTTPRDSARDRGR